MANKNYTITAENGQVLFDNTTAHLQGWQVCEDSSEILKLETSARFDDDYQAMLFVACTALSGSDYHERAIRYSEINTYNKGFAP